MNRLLFYLSRKLNYPFCPPEILQISLTYRCNLSCSMCSIRNRLSKEEEISKEQVFKIVDDAKAYGIASILLTGGEPFLRNDFFEICTYIHDQGLALIVTSNGCFADRWTLSDIAKLPLSHLHLSLDGMRDANDNIRGKGMFDEVVNTIEQLGEYSSKSYSLGIACTVMHDNVGDLAALVALADQLKTNSINFQPLICDNSDFSNKNKSPFWLSDQDIDTLKNEIKKIRNYQSVNVSVYEEPSLDLLVPYYQQELTKQDWVCFGGFKTAFVCFDKNKPLLYSCHGVCGDLDSISIKQAWRSKDAYRLRIHSKKCNDLCLQSCYSLSECSTLSALISSYEK